MTRRRWQNQSPEFRAKVAIAALKGDKILAELVPDFDVHPNRIPAFVEVAETVEMQFAKSGFF